MPDTKEPMQGLTQGFIERERQKFEDVKGYLDASSEASARTRNFVVALIVASVLTAVGILNSLQSSWMIERIENWRSSDSTYLVKYIGESPRRDDYEKRSMDAYLQHRECYQHQQSITAQPGGLVEAFPSQLDQNVSAWCAVPPNLELYRRQAGEEYDKAADLYKRRYDAFWLGVTHALVDNRFFVHVPFFGLSFDVNDLGILSGVGLVSILLLLWFSADTKLENLKLSFSETRKLRCLAEFYRLAAMRQVLTMPPLPDRKARPLEVWLPKPIAFLPLAVYFWLFIHDVGTSRVGRQLSTVRMRIFVGSEVLFLIGIAILAVQCFVLTRRLDSAWMDGWCLYIAEQFERTGDSEWLERAYRLAQRRKVLARQWIQVLPQESGERYACEKSNDTHAYTSRDQCRLVVNLEANSVKYIRHTDL